jgi:hypothetical protein
MPRKVPGEPEARTQTRGLAGVCKQQKAREEVKTDLARERARRNPGHALIEEK